MQIAEGVYVLPIPRGPQGAGGFLNLTLILDMQNGDTLVDAGLPDQAEAISSALVEAGIGVRDLRRIISTTSVRGPPSCARAKRRCWRIRPIHPK